MKKIIIIVLNLKLSSVDSKKRLNTLERQLENMKTCTIQIGKKRQKYIYERLKIWKIITCMEFNGDSSGNAREKIFKKNKGLVKGTVARSEPTEIRS